MPQLKIPHAGKKKKRKKERKMPCSTTKTQHSQINLILFFFLKNEYYQGWERGMGGGFVMGIKFQFSKMNSGNGWC